MTAPPPRVSPYQGLNAFDERDAPYFFGREKDTRLIVADLFASPLTLLYGASGVGKSSVLRAGVLPALRHRLNVAALLFSSWQEAPLPAIRRAVVATLQIASPSETLSFADFLSECAARAERRLMLVFDQFEEYPLYHTDDDAFGKEFPEAATRRGLPATFMLSLREEAISRLDRFEGRIPGIFDSTRRIDHLSQAAAREAIERPLPKYNADHATEAPMSIEPELVATVLEQVQTVRLGAGRADSGTGATAATLKKQSGRIEAPYLQLVMTRIWDEERREGSPMLRWATLSRLGTSEKIVHRHLEKVMERLTDEDRDIAARIFQQLVTPSGTKVAHSVADLADHAGVGSDQMAAILAMLASGTDRILRNVAPLPGRPDAPRFEIFHDRLGPAVLDWRARYLREQELRSARSEELDRQQAASAGRSFPPAKTGTRRGSVAVGTEPPYGVIAGLLQRRQVLVVIGAGVSSSSRPPGAVWTPDSAFPPSGNELRSLLGAEADFPADEVSHSTLAEAASYFRARVGVRPFNDRLVRLFDRTYLPSPTHELLARAAALTPQIILTTTFDGLIEQALAAAAVPYDVLASNLSQPSSSWLIWRPHGATAAEPIHPKSVPFNPDRTLIFKLFGSLERGRSSLTYFALSEEDESRLFAHLTSDTPSFIREVFAARHALFVGMGLASWTQRLLLFSLRGEINVDKRGWAIVRAPSKLDVVRWQMANIELFDVDINVFTERLAAAYNAP